MDGKGAILGVSVAVTAGIMFYVSRTEASASFLFGSALGAVLASAGMCRQGMARAGKWWPPRRRWWFARAVFQLILAPGPVGER